MSPLNRPLKDFLPAANLQFVAWIKQFVKAASPDPEAVGLTPAQVAELDQARAELYEAILASQRAHAAARSATTTVRQKKEKADALARQAARIAQGFPGTTDGLRKSLGISVRGERELPNEPQDPRELVAWTNRSGQVFLKWDRANNKPGTVFLIEIRQGDRGPWQFVAAVTATRYKDVVRPPGVYIQYRVCATRAGRKSLWCNPANLYVPDNFMARSPLAA